MSSDGWLEMNGKLMRKKTILSRLEVVHSTKKQWQLLEESHIYPQTGALNDCFFLKNRFVFPWVLNEMPIELQTVKIWILGKLYVNWSQRIKYPVYYDWKQRAICGTMIRTSSGHKFGPFWGGLREL